MIIVITADHDIYFDLADDATSDQVKIDGVNVPCLIDHPKLRIWLGEELGIKALSLPYQIEYGGAFLKDAAHLETYAYVLCLSGSFFSRSGKSKKTKWAIWTRL